MKRLFWLLLLALLLTGCAPEVTLPIQPESEPAPVVEPEKPPEAPPEEEKPEPAALPEPKYILSPGPAVTVNGRSLTGGSVFIQDTCYVCLRELTEALGVELQRTEPVSVFSWQGAPVAILDDRTEYQVGGQQLTFSQPPVIPALEVFVPVLELAEGLGLSVFEDFEETRIYLTTIPSGAVPEGYYVPVLMYHGVTDDTWGYSELFVSPAELEKQLQYIADNGFTTIHFSDLYRVDQIEKPVLLTFDDGYLDNYTELFPILQKYQAKATVFVITGSIGTHPRFMTAEQVREMADSELVEIQPHTVTHPDLTLLTPEQQAYEIDQSRMDVLRMTGREPYVFCYPSGRYSADTLALLQGKFDFALRMDGETYYTDAQVLEINRWFVSRWTDLWAYGDMLEP